MIEFLITAVVEFITTVLSAIVDIIIFLFSRLILLIFIVSVILLLLAFLKEYFLPSTNNEESTLTKETKSDADTRQSAKDMPMYQGLHTETKEKESGAPLRSDAFYESAWEELEQYLFSSN